MSAIIIVNFSCSRSIQTNKIPDKELSSGFVRIYVMRPSPVGFLSNKTNIYENNFIIGRIGSRAYLVWDTKPGDITLQGGNGFIKILAQPGKTYYLKLQPNFSGIGSNGFSFIPLTEKEGIDYLAKLKQPLVKLVS